MPDLIKRLNYFDQQFLRATDFSDEQGYHRRMLREHQRAFHTPGVGSGLTLRKDPNDSTCVFVAPGTAVDADGQAIVLADEVNLELQGEPDDTAVYVTIAYASHPSDPDGGPANFTRTTDQPVVAWSANLPADATRTIVLGLVKRKVRAVDAIESTGRMRSGETVAGPLSVQGDLAVSGTTTTAGMIAGGIALGRDPAGIDYPYEHETIGVSNPGYNLRVQSPNAVIVHAGGAERGTFTREGDLRIHGSGARFMELVVASGADGRVRTRHVGGKSHLNDGDDTLYLNWGTGFPVHVGSDLTVQGAATAAAGMIAGGIALGRDPAGIDYPYEIETVGVANPSYNLRLQSPNAVIVHAGGAERVTFTREGDLRIHGSGARFTELVVASGADGRVRTRHVGGKHHLNDGDDTLYLNWGTGFPVHVGSDLTVQGAATAAAGMIAGGIALGRDPAGIDYPYEYETIGVSNPGYNLRVQSPNAVAVHAGGAQRATFTPQGDLQLHGDPSRFIELTLAAGGNGRLHTRHIDGKHYENDSDDDLYLNWSNGRAVQTGAGLSVGGRLQLRHGRTTVDGFDGVGNHWFQMGDDENKMFFAIQARNGRPTLMEFAVPCYGTFMRPSDARLKTGIQAYEGVLERLAGVRTVSYAMKDGGPERQVGVIAQEVRSEFPELVCGQDMLAVDYDGLAAILLQAVRELTGRVATLEAGA